MTNTPVLRAIEAAGGQASASRALNRPPAFIWQIVNGRRPLPAALAIPLEIACGGVVTRYELRPDVFGEKK